jgi:hypothetical protein
MLSGYLFSVNNLLSTLISTAWVPLVMLAYCSGLARRAMGPTVGSALLATCMFFGGGVEVVYATLGVILLITVAPFLFLEGADYSPFRRRISLFGIFLLLFLGMSSVQLLPFIELAGQSVRTNGLSFVEATTWSLHPKDLVQLLIPDLFGYQLRPEEYWRNQSWLKTLYLGCIPILLSLFFFTHRDKRRWGFLIVIGLSLALAFGRYNPFYVHLYNYVPLLDKVRYPVKFLFLATLVISVTAGLGFERLRAGIKDGDVQVKRVAKAILVCACCAACSLGLLGYFDTHVAHFLQARGLCPPSYNDIGVNLHNLKRLLFVTVLFGSILFVGLRLKAYGRFLPFAVITLLAVDLFFAHKGFYTTMKAEAYHRNSPNMDFVLSDRSLFRTYVTPKTMEERSVLVSSLRGLDDPLMIEKEKIVPGLGLERHIFHSGGAAVLPQARVRNLHSLIKTSPRPDSTNLLSLMNVKYVISVPEIDSPEFALAKTGVEGLPPDVQEAAREKTVKVYENLGCLPRAFLVGEHKVVLSDDDFKEILSRKDFRPQELVLLEEEPEQIPSGADTVGHREREERVEVLEYHNNSVSLEVSLARPKFLFMSESYYPGWKAYVDGDERRIYRANYAFRAVFLEPGDHRVDFIYRPMTFLLGAAISVATLMSVIGFLWTSRRGKSSPLSA